MTKIRCSTIISLCFLAFLAGKARAAEQVVDRIVAVVGEEIILLSDIQQKMGFIMMNRNLNENSSLQVLRALQNEVLQGEIDDRLLIQKAERDSLVADPRQIDLLLNQRISELKQKMVNEENYKKALEENGFSEQKLRYMYRVMAEKNVLQEMILQNVRRLISVTPQDLDAWYAAHKDSLPTIPEEFKLSHIMIVPRISAERKQEVREKLESIRQRALAGEDFASLAKEFSEDPGSAADGGNIGYFKQGIMIKEFSDVAFVLKVGEISDIVETTYGLHIIKVEDKRDDEVSVRHILMRMTPDENDEKVVIDKLNDIRLKILSGNATFEDMAKQFSEDPETRDLGGKMKWLTQDDIVNSAKFPSLYTTSKQLKKGEISEPFKSSYGYHIAALEDYIPEHKVNLKDDRNLIEGQIYQEKTIKELELILAKLRTETYIDIRLE